MSASLATPKREDRPNVSIVLATLNERGNLPEVITRILQQSLPPLEVLVGRQTGARMELASLSLTWVRRMVAFAPCSMMGSRPPCAPSAKASKRLEGNSWSSWTPTCSILPS